MKYLDTIDVIEIHFVVLHENLTEPERTLNSYWGKRVNTW